MGALRKRKWLATALCLVLISLINVSSHVEQVSASTETQVVMNTSGIIITSDPTPTPSPSPSSSPSPSPTSLPTPTPTPTPSPTPIPVNLAPTTTGWSLRPYGLSQYVFIDNTVLYNGQATLRVGPDYDQATSGGTENDRAVYPTGGDWGTFYVSPGDHIYFSAWIKTDHSSQGNDGMSDKGGRIGIDFYTPSGRVMTSPPNVPAVAAGSFVPWGTSTWIQFTYDLIVPSGYGITACIPWLQVIGYTDTGNVWYGNIEFYITY